MFKASRARGHARVSVMTETVADLSAQKMQIKDHPNRSVIELYPGPGQLTRSMALAGAKKVITIDHAEAYQSSLQMLVDNSEGRIQHFPLNPLADPFDDLLDPTNNVASTFQPQPWDKVHSELVIAGTLPNSSLGEKVLMDLLLASMERISIFSLGRIQMYMFCNKDTFKKLSASPGSTGRHKMAIFGEASAKITSLLAPGSDNFYLPTDYELLHIVPLEKPKIQSSIEVADYCLRNLFANKSHPLNKVIKLLGPGAEILLGRLSFDTNIKIKHLTLEQLNEVIIKFEQWPLRPTVLYDDMFWAENRKR
ncbi:Mitochondrial transcription factor 1 [Mortierella sp. GBA43]|nr:Mitochondrial transcription factor 1 [Mortierella sp. GBA43]